MEAEANLSEGCDQAGRGRTWARLVHGREDPERAR